MEWVERRILVVRGLRVMLSGDLARHGVAVKRLNESVSRNVERFPGDFMFQLNQEEFADLKSQSATSSWGGSRRGRPYAFTQEGIAMLSAVLRSPTAISVSIQIMRAFVRLREMLGSEQAIRQRLEEIARRLDDDDEKFAAVFEAIRAMMNADEEETKRPRIGYQSEGLRRGQLSYTTMGPQGA